MVFGENSRSEKAWPYVNWSMYLTGCAKFFLFFISDYIFLMVE
jgi:hypothetical protein